ncbi:MAG: hypothetical protein AAF517_22610 [Planctomycetota bacterium]
MRLTSFLLVAAISLVTLRVRAVDSEVHFNRGDANSDGLHDISDPIFILSYAFAGGDSPKCRDAADANDDGTVDLSDAVTLLWYLFQGARPPAEPFGYCGTDPTEDELGCELFRNCPGVEFSEFVLARFDETDDTREPTSLDRVVFCFSDDPTLFDSLLIP